MSNLQIWWHTSQCWFVLINKHTLRCVLMYQTAATLNLLWSCSAHVWLWCPSRFREVLFHDGKRRAARFDPSAVLLAVREGPQGGERDSHVQGGGLLHGDLQREGPRPAGSQRVSGVLCPSSQHRSVVSAGLKGDMVTEWCGQEANPVISRQKAALIVLWRCALMWAGGQRASETSVTEAQSCQSSLWLKPQRGAVKVSEDSLWGQRPVCAPCLHQWTWAALETRDKICK